MEQVRDLEHDRRFALSVLRRTESAPAILGRDLVNERLDLCVSDPGEFVNASERADRVDFGDGSHVSILSRAALARDPDLAQASPVYDIVYADFPWPYTSFGTAELPYAHMTEGEIAAFDFAPFMASRCVIFAWVTGPKLDLAFRCIEAWKARHKLRYLGMPYIWVKTRLDGAPIGASGPRPTLVKPLGECVIALTNVKRGRPFPLLTEAQVQWVDDSEAFLTAEILSPKARRGEHSRKPAQVRDRIVELLGDRPRIELFARERVAGWEGHGNEYPHKPTPLIVALSPVDSSHASDHGRNP